MNSQWWAVISSVYAQVKVLQAESLLSPCRCNTLNETPQLKASSCQEEERFSPVQQRLHISITHV